MTESGARVVAGKYRIESTLGEGGMGTVFAATDLSMLRRRVAIKMLRPEVAEVPEYVERLREEAFSLASMQHPNIVHLYEFHRDGPDGSFLVMELVEGETLSARLQREVTVPVELALDCAQQLLSALAAAHSRGVVHRDVKPSNIVITQLPAERTAIKVLDFGIAKLTEETIRRQPTTAMALLGTPAYMAPEQIAGQTVDGRADVYAAALVLYRMLSGTNPFDGGDVVATLRRVRTVDPAPLSKWCRDVPEHVVRAVARALAKDPGERFSSAVEFAHALQGDTSAARLAALGTADTVTAGVEVRPPTSSLSAAVHVTPTPERTQVTPPAVLLMLGAMVGSFAVGALTLVFAVSLPRLEATATERVAPATASAASIAMPPAPSASSAASSVVPAASMSAAPPPEPRRPIPVANDCMCFPDVSTDAHPKTEMLSPTSGATSLCECNAPDGEVLCAKPFINDGTLCPLRWRAGSSGDPCEGFRRENDDPASGAFARCSFNTESAHRYPHVPGRRCRGFTVDGDEVAGHIACAEPDAGSLVSERL